MNRNNPPERENKSTKANRDPITKQPGAHPIGTGVGAAAGGAAGVGAAAAAGAVAGTAAGPVGTGVGAVAGAVIGGLGGKAVAENMNPTSSKLELYLDYTVVDRAGDKVGSIDAVWEDHTGQLAYVGIKTGWLGFGRAHVVPAEALEVSDATRKIRLPYTADTVKGAPAFEQQSEIDGDAERNIAEYYARHGLSERFSGESTPPREAQGEEEIRIPLSAEEVKVGKREVEYGGVRLRKIIRTETVNQPVELKREEVVIERAPAGDRPISRSDIPFREEEIYVPLRREEAVVEKSTHATEEVRIGKRSEREQREISETIRREDVEIDREGDAKQRDTL